MTITAKFQEIRSVFNKFDTLHNSHGAPSLDDAQPLRVALAQYFATRESNQSVLGIDIYQYSRMEPECQRLVPSLFKLLYDETLNLCRKSEPFIFGGGQEGAFISTGDGGFQIFRTPLQAIIFAVNFESYLASFNAFYLLPNLRRLMGRPLSVRYAITFDLLFAQDDNVFGAAIINNARIMARDSLNRFLLDSNTIEWFQAELASVESLLMLKSADLASIRALGIEPNANPQSRLFGSSNGEEGIKSVHLQKIGVVTSKQTQLDVYSLMIQIAIAKKGADGGPAAITIVTIGNLNAGGISA